MRQKLLRFVIAAGISVVAVPLATQAAAHADGATVIGMPTATATATGLTTINCNASGSASWSGSGYTEITINGQSSCNTAIWMSGQAFLIPNGASSPSVTTPTFNAFTAAGATGPGYSSPVPVGSVFFIQYKTTLQVGSPYKWTTVPPHCSGANTQVIQCSMIRPFSAN